MALGVAALLASREAVAAEWTITPTVTVSESYSDNIDLDPDGAETSAFVTDVTPAISIVGSSARASASISAGVTASQQTAGDDRGLEFDADLAAAASLEAVKEVFFIDVNGSVSQQVLDRRAAQSSANADTVQTYEISPSLRRHFGGYADGEARYAFTQFFSGSKTTSDSSIHRIDLRLDSGRYFTRIQWSVDASASKDFRSLDNDVERRDATLNLEYAFSRFVSALGSIGYQQFDDGEPANKINGIVWDAGFRWRPGPRTEMELTYGRRDADNSFRGNLSYKFSSRTRLQASYAEVLETSQGAFSRAVANTAIDPNTGQIIDLNTGLPFDPRTSPLSIRDETTRTKRFNLNLTGSRGRNSFSLGAFVERQDVEPSGDDEDAAGINASWNRQLNRRLNFSLGGSYVNTEFKLDQREDHDYAVNGSLDYQVAKNLNAAITYGYLQRDSTDASQEYTENSVSVSVSMQF